MPEVDVPGHAESWYVYLVFSLSFIIWIKTWLESRLLIKGVKATS